MPPAYREDYASIIEATRSAIGKGAFDEAWAEGRSLTLEQVTAMVMQPLSEDLDLSSVIDSLRRPNARYHTAAERFELTEREIEVLGMVAQGLTDAQVAERLYISPRTVSKHLQSIYGKIQVNTRSAATRFALEKGLV
jgi:DNA-binding NarL/FixJ family response regulator